MKPPRTSHLAALLLLVLMAFLAGGAARHESVTVDEIAHTGAGVSYLQKLDLRLNEEHPPLAKVVAALPLVLRGAYADYSHLSWTFSGKLFYQFLGEWVFGHFFLMQWNDPHSTLLWARAPMLLLTLWLAAGRRLGRPALPFRFRDHARISRLWTARNYRHRARSFLGASGLATPADVAFSYTRNRRKVRSGTGWRVPLEVFLGTFVVRVCRLCFEFAMQAAARAAA